jgi:hypothetical protein
VNDIRIIGSGSSRVNIAMLASALAAVGSPVSIDALVGERLPLSPRLALRRPERLRAIWKGLGVLRCNGTTAMKAM